MSSWLFLEEIQVANKYLRKYSTSLASGKCKWELFWGPISPRFAAIEKRNESKGWWGYGKGIVIRRWWECKWLQLIWRLTWTSSKIKAEPLPTSATPLWVCAQRMLNLCKGMPYTSVFMTELFTIAKVRNPLMPIRRWRDKANAFVHNGVLLSHKETWSHGICREMDVTGNHYVTWNKSGLEKQGSHIFLVCRF